MLCIQKFSGMYFLGEEKYEYLYTNINGCSLNIYEQQLCYINSTICMYITPTNWTAIATNNYRVIKTAKAHYEMFAGVANYIANIMITYLAVQHFTFAFP